MAERVFHSLMAFGEFLQKQAVAAVVAQEEGAKIAADILHEKAHRVFGDASKLASLAPATQADRLQKGYSANDPLLRDGSLLRDNVEKAHGPFVAAIGSSEPIQGYHEFGYVNARTGRPVPPRPVFLKALHESEPAVAEIQAAIVSVTLGFHPHVTRELKP